MNFLLEFLPSLLLMSGWQSIHVWSHSAGVLIPHLQGVTQVVSSHWHLMSPDLTESPTRALGVEVRFLLEFSRAHSVVSLMFVLGSWANESLKGTE